MTKLTEKQVEWGFDKSKQIYFEIMQIALDYSRWKQKHKKPLSYDVFVNEYKFQRTWTGVFDDLGDVNDKDIFELVRWVMEKSMSRCVGFVKEKKGWTG